MEDNSRTLAELVENKSDNFPLEHDHHPINSFSIGWNLGRLQGRIVGQLVSQGITVDEVYQPLYHTEMISYDSKQNFLSQNQSTIS